MKKLILMFLAAFLLTGCTPDLSNNSSTNIQSTVREAIDNNTKILTTQDASTTEPTSNTTALVGELKVHYIDVGQADCIYIELPNNENMLIDAGNNADKDTILKYLNSQGVKKLDYVIGTHPHEDHIGSLDSVINSYDIGKIYMPKVSSNTKTFEDVLNAIQNKGLKVIAPESGSFLINLRNQTDKTTKDELVIQFLAPNGDNYEDINNYSIVVKITFRDTTMLFMGDAEDVSEDEIISAGYDVKADLIKIGHHGSAYSTTANFLEDVQAQYAVISVGKDNDYGHPAQSTIDRFIAAGIQVFRTDELGTITAVSDGKAITLDKSASPIKEQAPPKTVVSVQTPSAQNQDITVYITKTGEKYHTSECRYLSKSKISISLSEAKTAGYTACSVCNPPK